MIKKGPDKNLQWIPRQFNNGWEYQEIFKGSKKDGNTDLLNFLAETYRHSSLKVWQDRIISGQIKINKITISKTCELVHGDLIHWHRPPWEEESIPINWDIIFDNQDLLIINKPSGLPTTPGGGFLEHTLTNLLYSKYKKTPGSVIPKPIHRLGRCTSGIILCARQKQTRAYLSKLFSNNISDRTSFRRIYRALAKSNHNLQIGQSIEVKTPISKQSHYFLDGLWNISKENDPCSLHSSKINCQYKAFSSVKLLEKRNSADLLEITIFTGRPHQIRIHLASLGTPLVGDPLYREDGQVYNKATPGEGGYFLHSYKLLNIPIDNKMHSFEASLPKELQRQSHSN